MSFDIVECYCMPLSFKETNKMFLAHFLIKIQYCGDLPSPRSSELGLKPHSFDLQSTTSQANLVGADQTYINRSIYISVNKLVYTPLGKFYGQIVSNSIDKCSLVSFHHSILLWLESPQFSSIRLLILS